MNLKPENLRVEKSANGLYTVLSPFDNIYMNFSQDEAGMFHLHFFKGNGIHFNEIDELFKFAVTHSGKTPEPVKHTEKAGSRDAVPDHAALSAVPKEKSDKSVFCEGFIPPGQILDRLFEDSGTAKDWQECARYLRQIIEWKQSGNEKWQCLCKFIRTLDDEQMMKEWEIILSAPNDYLKIAEADPELFEAEKKWESEWFSDSILKHSNLARCRENEENIIISEADWACKKMPMESWNNLLEWMPCTAKLCPEWKQMLDISCKLNLDSKFQNKNGTVPAEIIELKAKLPECLKDFLKRKILFK